MSDFRRDRYDRPYVTDPNDIHKEVSYQRVTTLAGMVENTFNLTRWQKRQVAKGIALKPALAEAINAHFDDNKEIDKLAELAMSAAGSDEAAMRGTAFHAVTDTFDYHEPLGTLSPEFEASLAAYAEATADMTMLRIEQPMVNDKVKTAGTADRIVEIEGQQYIFDTKSGRTLDYGIGKIICQLANYANSSGYDIATGERFDIPVSREWGLVAHVPYGEGTCDVYWVDLIRGWQGVQLAAEVRDWQKIKLADVAHKF